MTGLEKQVLITTRFGRYSWEPIFQLVEWYPKGSRKPTFTISLRSDQNTELRAMMVATNHMLKMLKEQKRKMTNG